jgi:glycosyltransferase involved in cell wall biosynthesis
VIIPCYREAGTIHRLLEGLLAQTYPVNRLEVVIADGLSDDGTRDQIAGFVRIHPDLDVKIVDNPLRIIPAALNAAITASRGEIVARLDGHSYPSPDYIETCVDLLEKGAGDMVGGGWQIEPGNSSWAARSIAAAAKHPFGVGDAYYRWATTAREVDTIAFWVLPRTWIDKVGLFDETLRSNEDYDFNSRFRAAGGRIWLDPSVACVYYARSTFGALASQYWRYGFWKARMARRKPETLRLRQILPPLCVLGAVSVLATGTIAHWVLWPLGGIVSLYLCALAAAAVQSARKCRQWDLVAGMPWAILIMHWVWAVAFWVGLVSSSKGKD